jgi:hypothetical protein
VKAKSFEYIKGPAKTNIPWFRPDPELLNTWKRAFLKISGVENYKFWVCGGALERWQTWDTDILVTGKVTNYEELQDILVTATQLGFEHRQLIDINWNDSYEKYLEMGPCKFRSICCDHHYEKGWCDVRMCTNYESAPLAESITICKEIIKNGRVEFKRTDIVDQLGPSLWKRTVPYASGKQIERMQKGVVYTGRPTLITEELDFKDIVDWP